jgi:hypothetical protein
MCVSLSLSVFSGCLHYLLGIYFERNMAHGKTKIGRFEEDKPFEASRWTNDPRILH